MFWGVYQKEEKEQRKLWKAENLEQNLNKSIS